MSDWPLTPQEHKYIWLDEMIDMKPYDALVNYAGLNDDVLDWIAIENDLDFDDMLNVEDN